MAEPSRRTAEERSIGELFGELSQDMALLVRQEAQLAKTEMQTKLSRVTGDLISLAAGGVVALVGGLAITAAVILLLIHPIGVTPWLAALIVGALLGIIGWVMLQRGLKDLKRTDPTPRRTVETIKEDIQWAKEQRP
ncbi:MAG TPA: phage holin family protein [Gemmatimonadales bacterium]|nr:phage holin family protein [Gemmatimonadales bacterium]HET9727187.1 phage holin family protein [Gemmatimonadales bacterium]